MKLTNISEHPPANFWYSYCSPEQVMKGISHLAPFSEEEHLYIVEYMNDPRYFRQKMETITLKETGNSYNSYGHCLEIKRSDLIKRLEDIIRAMNNTLSEWVYVTLEQISTDDDGPDYDYTNYLYELQFNYKDDSVPLEYSNMLVTCLTNRIISERKEKVRIEKSKHIKEQNELQKELRKEELLKLVKKLQDKQITAEEFADQSESLMN